MTDEETHRSDECARRGAYRFGIWFSVTGGGDALTYLNWLAAQWIIWTECETSIGPEAATEIDAFDEWLTARFSNATGLRARERARLAG